MILNLYKKEGETPLERLERFREKNTVYANEKMTYAGRLDPMADGVLLILSGEDVYKKDQMLSLEKEYDFEVLWGVKSDTHDILGEITISENVPTDELIIEGVSSWKGQIELPYPAYSSRKVAGKPLWQHARENNLSELEIPKKSMNIIDLQYQGSRTVKANEILDLIIERVNRINGDFRQEEILDKWKGELGVKEKSEFKISSFKATVSAGTYIRSLAVRMGEKYGTGALAWTISRTRVGEHKISDSIR
jgi:tRNA pseudouridine55 synthase